jgi:DNA repair photolyase
MEAVAEMSRNGISSGVMVAPLMPGINDDPEWVAEIVALAREAGASFVGHSVLHLRDEVRDVFFAWLEAKRPDLVPEYERLYANGRAYLPADKRARMGSRVKGWRGEGAGRGSGRSRGFETAALRERAQPRADSQAKLF